MRCNGQPFIKKSGDKTNNIPRHRITSAAVAEDSEITIIWKMAGDQTHSVWSAIVEGIRDVIRISDTLIRKAVTYWRTKLSGERFGKYQNHVINEVFILFF